MGSYTETEITAQVAWGKEFLDFQMLDEFNILDLQGNVILANISPKRKWRVRRLIYTPPQYQYYLSLGVFASERDAQKIIQNQSVEDIQTQIRPIEKSISTTDLTISENTVFEVIMGGFNTFEEVETFKTHHMNIDAIIKSEVIRDVRGTIEICDDEYIQSAQIENGLILKPVQSNAKCRIYGLSTSRKHKRVLPTQTSYRGEIRFLLDHNGGIQAIHQMPIDRYLQGILAALGTQLHPDALKSFAVIGRTWLLSRIGLQHWQEPYDFCYHQHCLPFCGSADFPKEVREAVESTQGEVLLHKDRLFPVSFTMNCGGYSDQNLTSSVVVDSSNTKTKKISDNEQFEKWMKEDQDSYCCKHQPGYNLELLHLVANYRWEVNYSKSEIEGVLSTNLDVPIGHLYDIVEGERTKGGRLLSLEIIGSKKNITIHHAEHIRALFNPKPLPSNAFYIEKIRDEEGIPIEYVFLGAGEGNGNGICVAGASHMAMNQIKYLEIIQHYFPKATRVKLH